jgi:hypothetical protein
MSLDFQTIFPKEQVFILFFHLSYILCCFCGQQQMLVSILEFTVLITLLYDTVSLSLEKHAVVCKQLS